MSASADESQLTCPKCGTPLQRGGHLAGQCFVCLLELTLDEEQVPRARAERFDHYQVASHPDGTPVELGRGAMGITYNRVLDRVESERVANDPGSAGEGKASRGGGC